MLQDNTSRSPSVLKKNDDEENYIIGSKRESNSWPVRVGSLLEGRADGVVPDGIKVISLESKLTTSCRYITTLAVLMLSALGLAVGAIYFEVCSFLNDNEWNNILHNKIRFPKTVSKDKYFGGKFRSQIKMLNLDGVDSQVKSFLHRSHSLEYAFMGLALIVCILLLIHIILFILWRKFRFKLILTYLGFGMFGIIIFTAASVLAVSTLAFTSSGFIKLRIHLEDKVGIEANDTNNAHRYSSSDTETDHPNFNCLINNKTRKDYVDLERLLTITKMCAYRHVTPSPRDTCSQADTFRNIILIIDGKRYNTNDLEDLRLCPSDLNKIFAFSLAFLASLVCWIVMWTGSQAEKQILEPHFDHNNELVWIPHTVTAIQGWTARMHIPSYMEIELSMRPSNADFTLPDWPDNQMDGSPTVPPFNMPLTSSSKPSIGMPLYNSPSIMLPSSKMSIPPSLIIHPPIFVIRPSSGSSDGGSPANVNTQLQTQWFNYYE